MKVIALMTLRNKVLCFTAWALSVQENFAYLAALHDQQGSNLHAGTILRVKDNIISNSPIPAGIGIPYELHMLQCVTSTQPVGQGMTIGAENPAS